jgi:hypothetical protein
MIEPKYIELIHREIDGVNTPKESAKLNDYVSRHPEARQLYDELVATSTLLSRVREEEPPVHLTKAVLNAIQHQRHAAQKNASLVRSIKELVASLPGHTSPRLKYASAFAFGLMAGLFIYSMLAGGMGGNSPIDISQFYGAITKQQAAGHFEHGGKADVDLPEVTGAIDLRCSKELVIAEVVLHPAGTIDIVFEFESDHLRFSSFTKIKGGERTSINDNGSTLRIANVVEGGYIFVFVKKAPAVTPVNFKIISDNRLLFEKSLAVTEGGE